MNTTQCLSAQQLSQLIDQSLSNADAARCESHLEHCAQCQQQLESLAGQQQWWTDAARLLSTDWETEQRDVDGIDAARHARSATLKQVRQILQSPVHPEMLGRLGSYDVESFIGQGGFGVVFKAFDTELNRPVAIKVLAPHLASSGVARRRFAREAQAAAAVVHPNVVPIHAVQAEADYPYLVMTYVPGSSLQDFVQQHGPLETKSIVRIAGQVAAGLAAAHRQGLVHRDIKPANILLENDLNRALITDFGLARAADDAAASQTGWLAGTPHYMSPEQARGDDLDGRSDLFSLGSVLYFMATGREPFRAAQPLSILQKIATDKPLSAHLVNSDIPKTLSRIIDRLLEKSPDDRIQSAQQLSDLLESLLGHLQQPQTIRLPRLPRSPRQFRQAGWSAVVAISLLGLFTCGYFLRSLWLPEDKAMEASIVVRSEPVAAQPTVAALMSLQAELREDGERSTQTARDIQQLDQMIGAAESNWSSAAPSSGQHSDPIFVEALNIEREIQRLESELQGRTP